MAAVLLLLLLAWPVDDSESEVNLAIAVALAPFPLSMTAAWLARLPVWPLIGLMAPFAMLGVFVFQPDYDSWVSHQGLSFALSITIPVVSGFVFTAMLCKMLFGMMPSLTSEDARTDGDLT
ncbi:hypothetical protein SAMN05421869_12885 [Nonomuraea jiangxiensis]|uniref:Uncharacterized protein n=1 Tax=Nonomuraea jiangxiensis TaxID=633440 RepID=A0A1G9LQE1_9ACTN|nr:hypothetical protein SAMN05421869_12885 [Nonomuraea jiangxiensis]